MARGRIGTPTHIEKIKKVVVISDDTHAIVSAWETCLKTCKFDLKYAYKQAWSKCNQC